ncbi:MAG TPA: AAA family ATPase [Bacteroidia bacterium]|nr:AAA family ATPase [Bacteroidia bacterium]
MENYIENPETLIFKDDKGVDAPKPAMLFSNFWRQDELAVFFGNQQSGKSAVAVQIAEALSTGKAIEGFKLESAPQKVLYFDFDKSGYHFNQLYAGHLFSPNFRRVVVNKKNLDFKHLAEQFFFSVEELMCEEGAEVMIFDSLPAIKCFVKDSYFLKGIQRLKEYSELSILLVGETKKEVKGKPLRLNHLDAHKQLMGFADSIFALGHTGGDVDERYLIHLKSAEKRTCNKDNVVMGKMRLSHGPFGCAQGDSSSGRDVIPGVAEVAVTGVTTVTPFLPGFVFNGYKTESCVIAPPPEGLELDILTLKQQQPELSFGQVARKLKTNKMKVKRVLEKYAFSASPRPMKTAEALNGTGETSFSNPGLQPGDMKTVTTLPTNPFRGNVEKSNQPSHPGVKEAATPNKPLTFSQRLKKQIAKKNAENMKHR